MKCVEELPDERVAFRATLVPRASRTEVIGWSESGSLRIRVTAAPVDDAANRELLKLLSKQLGVPKAELRIVSGARARAKRLTAPIRCKNRLLRFSDI